MRLLTPIKTIGLSRYLMMLEFYQPAKIAIKDIVVRLYVYIIENCYNFTILIFF